MRLAATIILGTPILLGSIGVADEPASPEEFVSAWEDETDSYMELQGHITLTGDYPGYASSAGTSKTLVGFSQDNQEQYSLTLEGQESDGLRTEYSLTLQDIILGNSSSKTMFSVYQSVELSNVTLTAAEGIIINSTGYMELGGNLTFDTSILNNFVLFASTDGLSFNTGFTLTINGSLSEGSGYALFSGFTGTELPTLKGTLSNGQLELEEYAASRFLNTLLTPHVLLALGRESAYA